MVEKPGISVKPILVNLFKVFTILILCTLLSWALSSLGIRESNILMVYLIGVLIVIIETRGYFWGDVYKRQLYRKARKAVFWNK